MLKQQNLSQKRQFFLLVVLVIFLAATLFLLYRNFRPKKVSQPAFIFKEPLEESIFEKGEFIPLSELTERLFQQDKFRSLKSHGHLPIKVEEIGRSNPFMPFFSL